jgi:transcriptional antiterminator NusG
MTDFTTADVHAPDEAPEAAATPAAPAPVDEAAAAAAVGDLPSVVEATQEIAEAIPAAEEAAEPAEVVQVVDEEALLEVPPPPVPRESPYDRAGRWYVVHSYAGYENKVKADLENRTTAMNMEEKVFEVVIPMEEVVEIKGGKKQVVQKKMFPGYLLVRCDLDDDSWYVIRNTPGVTGFVGPGTKPTPLSRKEVETFLQVPAEGDEEAPRKPKASVGFDINQAVRVLTGPFADFPGSIAEINVDQQKVKVLVDIFGRETPVELGFDDIAKL